MVTPFWWFVLYALGLESEETSYNIASQLCIWPLSMNRPDYNAKSRAYSRVILHEKQFVEAIESDAEYISVYQD